MTEIMILVIFIILLALSAILETKQNELSRLMQSEVDKKLRIASLEEELKHRRVYENQFENLFHELQLAKQGAVKAIHLQKRVVALEEQARVLDKIISDLAPADITKSSSEEKLEWLRDHAWIANQTIKIVTKAGLPSESPKEALAEIEKLLTVAQNLKTTLTNNGYDESQVDQFIDKTIEQINHAQTQILTLRGQLRSAQRLLGQAGRGTEKPACWASPASGKPEYIFDVTLTSRGVIVQDNAIPHRTDEQKRLPLQTIIFAKEVLLDKFLAISKPLYEWSNKQECRFFVRIFDLTKANEKAIYKRTLRTVGQHFYYYEVLNHKL
jgi:hypothetical protein